MFIQSIWHVAQTRKFWTYVVGIALLILEEIFGANSEITQLVITLATGYGIWKVPNES